MTDTKKRGMIVLFAAILVVGLFLSFFLGKYPISPKELFGIVAGQFTDIEPFWSDKQEHIFWAIRLPRILLACLVGAALATAGAVYQGVFENPMAAPDFLGASSGAGFGAALAIYMNMGNAMITIFAFAASLLTIWLVYIIGNRTRSNKTVGLVLAGLMVSALFQAGTSFIKLVADQSNQLPEITYWLMGSLTSTNAEDLRFAFVAILIGTVPLLFLRWKINVLTMGDAEAASMGVNVGRVRFLSLVCATLVTAASVSVSGMIGWVGLIVPHFARKIIGNNYKFLLPASIILGALFLLIVDGVARNVFAVEVPIGILTAVIGAPFFIYLITRGGEVR